LECVNEKIPVIYDFKLIILKRLRANFFPVPEVIGNTII